MNSSVAPCIKAENTILDDIADNSSGRSASDAASDDSSALSGSYNTSDSGSDSSVLTSDIYLEVDSVAAAKTKNFEAIEEDEGWKSFLLEQAFVGSEFYEKTAEEEKNEEESQRDNESNSSSEYSSCVSTVSSNILDETTSEEDTVVEGESVKKPAEKSNDNVADIEDAEDCFQLNALRSKLEFSTFQASLLAIAFKDMNKRKDQDHQRIVQLEQALTDAEDTVGDLLDEANSQRNERGITESLLEDAREKIADLQARVARKDTIVCTLRSNLQNLQQQNQQYASAKNSYESRLGLSESLLDDAYDAIESKQQDIVLLEETAKQLKAIQIKEDADKIETVCRLEATHQEMKILAAQNATMKGTISSLQNKLPKLELDLKVLKAKYVLQEHLAKLNNRNRKNTNALFKEMKQRLVEKIESLDGHSYILSLRLEKHLEKQEKEALQKELLQNRLQDANEKLDYFQKTARTFENDLNQLKAKFEEKGVEHQVIAQVVHKERVKNDLQETHVKLNPSEKVTKILESDFDELKKQVKDKDVAEKNSASLEAKLRFANAKESLLSKALSSKNVENMEQEDRLKEMSEKLASLRSKLRMTFSENELLGAKLEDLEKQQDYQPSTAAKSASDSLDCDKSADKTKSKSCNRKVHSLEAELSLLQVPEVIVADDTLFDSWSAEESEKAADSDDLNEGSVPTEEAELVPEVTDEDEDEWDFLSHSTPNEQQELWC